MSDLSNVWKDDKGNTCFGIKPEAIKPESDIDKKEDEEVKDELQKTTKSNRRGRFGGKSK